MKSKAVWLLLAVNVMLLLALTSQWLKPDWAHAAPGTVRPSDYLMISGEVVGGNSAIVYIIDTETRLLSARSLDTNGKLRDMGTPIPLDRVFGNAPSGAGPRGGAAAQR